MRTGTSNARAWMVWLCAALTATAVSLVVLESPAAVAADCSTVSCAPGNVTIDGQGAYAAAGQGALLPTTACGVRGELANVLTQRLDQTVDNRNFLPAGHTEGNYVDSNSFTFTPAAGTSLRPADTITLTMPRPAGGAGAEFPAAQQAYPANAEFDNSTITATPVAGFPGDAYAVTVTLAGASSGRQVRLDLIDPSQSLPADQGPGSATTPANNTNAIWLGNDGVNPDYTPNMPSISTTVGAPAGSSVAKFIVASSTAETVTIGARDLSFDVGLVKSTTLDFNGGAPSGTQTGFCADPGRASTPAREPGKAFSYLITSRASIFGLNLFLSSQVVTNVVTSTTDGVATATLTIPPGFPVTSLPVTVTVLGMTSPPGKGTPAKPAGTPPYANSAFSVATSVNPAPGYPVTAPVFQGAVDPHLAEFPVAAATSTLTASPTTAEVGGAVGDTTVGSTTGVIATATLRDYYANPVNNMKVSIFNAPGTGSHASLAPTTSSSGSTHPLSNDSGQASYAVVDSCAETVTLRGSDLTNTVGLPDTKVTFVAGAPIAPSATPTPANCGTTATRSQVQVVTPDGSTLAPGATGNAPADGTSQTQVKVTAADTFGNPAACHQLVLAPVSRTTRSTISPLPASHPCTGQENLVGYTGTDGVALFGVGSTRTETVAFGVTDVTKVAVWPVSGSAGDVATVAFAGASATASTVQAASPSAPAGNGAQINVTLQNSALQAVSGVTVSLKGCANVPGPSSPCVVDSTATVSPATVVTGTDGRASFTAKTTSTALPRTIYFQATNASDGTPLAEITSVTFTKGGGALFVNPNAILADGTDSAHAVLSLVSATGTPVAGASVSFAASGGALVQPSGATTSATGTAVADVTSTTAGSSSVSATASYPSTSAQCAGTFSAGTCTVVTSAALRMIGIPNTFSLNATPGAGIDADGVSASTVTVTALDANGAVVAGVPVGLVLTGDGGGQAVATTQSPITSNTGKATFTVTDTTAETVTISAGSVRLSGSAGPQAAPGCVPQPAPAADPPATCTATAGFIQTLAAASTVEVSPDQVAADGAAAATVKVTLITGNGGLVNGHAVSLVTGSGTTKVASATPGAVSGRSAPGEVVFTVSDTKAEQLFVYARDLFTGDTLSQGVLLTFLPTAVQKSTVLTSPGTLAAGGAPGAPSTSTVTVKLEGVSCTPTYDGHQISLSTPSATALVSDPALTSATGEAVFTVSDPAVESLTLTARDETCGTTLAKKGTVTFTASEANRSTVTATPFTSPAGGAAVTLTVTLKTAGGAAINNRLVTVPNVGFAVVKPISSALGYAAGHTNLIGQAKFTLTDPVAEDNTFTAYDGSSALDQRADVSFGATEGNQSTVTSSVNALPAAGPTTPVVVTLIGGDHEPIAGHTVRLVSSSTKGVVTPATVVSGADGRAVFSVSSAAPINDVTFTATDTTTGTTVARTVTLDFIASEASQSTITASKTTLQVKQKSTITVTLKNAAGQPLVGRGVTLGLSSPTASYAGLRPTLLGIPYGTAPTVTNAKGQIQFEVTDTAVGTTTVHATDSVSGVTLYPTLTLSFTKGTLL